MSNSLREKLLGLGFKAPDPEPPRPPAAKTAQPRPPRQAPAGAGPRSAPAGKPGVRRDGHKPRPGAAPGRAPRPTQAPAEMDLGKAYAIRAQREKQERIDAERLKQDEARLRREAKAKVAELVKDQALNDKDAEIARHFPYGGKIKRVHVTAEQLTALNAGALGVLQLDGRYLLVHKALLEQARAIFPPAVALCVDPDAPVADDPYADPKYQVPDDLVW